MMSSRLIGQKGGGQIDVADSVDRDECEAMFGSDLDRCLDVTGHYQRRPVGTVEHEGRLAIAHA